MLRRATASASAEKVRLHQLHPAAQAQRGAIDAGDFKRRRVNVHGIDPGGGKIHCAGQGNAAGAGAQIGNAAHCISPHPGRETTLDQLGNGRARYQHTLIDMERKARPPAALREIDHGNALADSPVEQCLETLRGTCCHGTHQVA
jgi:hypothetical protein